MRVKKDKSNDSTKVEHVTHGSLKRKGKTYQSVMITERSSD